MLERRKALIRNAIDTGKAQFALKDLRPLLVAHPKDASIQNLMGLTQMALRNYPRAITHLRLAYKLEIHPRHALNLSSALVENGDHEKAVNLIQYALKKWPTYKYKERLLHNLGYSFVKQRRLSRAEHWLKKALEENPTFYPTHIELARLYAKTKRPALSRKSYRHALDYCEVCYEPVGALARDYLRHGKLKKAHAILKGYQRIEGVDPDDRRRARKLLTLTERRLKQARIAPRGADVPAGADPLPQR